MSTEANHRAVKLVQGLLETSDRSTISPSAIQAMLAQVQPLLAMQGSADLDADWIVEELVRRFSVWIGKRSPTTWGTSTGSTRLVKGDGGTGSAIASFSR